MGAEQPPCTIAVPRSDGVEDLLMLDDGLLPPIFEPEREETDLLGLVQQRCMDVCERGVAAGLDNETVDTAIGSEVGFPLLGPAVAPPGRKCHPTSLAARLQDCHKKRHYQTLQLNHATILCSMQKTLASGLMLHKNEAPLPGSARCTLLPSPFQLRPA
jgi:hypothetical protein